MDSRGDKRSSSSSSSFLSSAGPGESRARRAAVSGSSPGTTVRGCAAAQPHPRTASSCLHPKSFPRNAGFPRSAAIRSGTGWSGGKRGEKQTPPSPAAFVPSGIARALSPQKFPGEEGPGSGTDGAEQGQNRDTGWHSQDRVAQPGQGSTAEEKPGTVRAGWHSQRKVAQSGHRQDRTRRHNRDTAGHSRAQPGQGGTAKEGWHSRARVAQGGIAGQSRDRAGQS